MSFVRKEDAAKAGKLVGAIVAVFGCAAWRVVGAVSPAKPASPPTETPVVASPAAAPPTAADKSSDKPIEVPATFPTTNSNPFRAITVDLPKPIPSTPEILPTTGSILPLPSTLGSIPEKGRPLTPVAPASAVEAPVRVSGVLGGPNATAVVEVGTESVVARVGSRLSNGATVMRIDATSLTLIRDGKTWTVLLGD